MFCRLPAFLVAAILLLAPAAFAQPAPDADAERLRSLLFRRDFETGLAEGARITAEHPERRDLEAWYLVTLARADRADEAVSLAKQVTARAPEDGWSWFALAGALNYQATDRAEAVDAAARAFELMPDNPDAIWIRAQTLANDPKRREEAVAFVDEHRQRVKNPAELLNAKAYALYLSSFPAGGRDEAKLKAAFDTFAEARLADPTNVNAHFLAGSYLNGLKRSAEAYPLLRKAAALAAAAPDVHQRYWSAIQAQQGLTAEQKASEIEADLAVLLEYDDRPGVLLAASYAARDLKQPARQKEFERRILEQFNDSREAEWVLIGRMREYSRSEEGAAKPEYRQMLRGYVARPRHYHAGLLGEAYRNLFFVLVKDGAVEGDELPRVADGMIKYETTNIHLTHVAAPIALADKKIHLDKAEQIAREAVAALEKRMESNRDFYKTEREFKEAMDRAPAIGHDALGWVLVARGRVDEAEKELLKAYELDPVNRDNLYHLGRFYEGRNDVARAEEYFVKGLSVQSPGTNPSAAALRSLYEKRHGGAAGYDEYLDGIRERDRMARKEKIVASRIASPERVTSFDLKALDGGKVSLDSLGSKVVVMNFWGIWCGWCVRELPDLQKLHEKYAGNEGVAILTINNDSNPDDVPPWMKEKKYTFGVLLDDGYVAKVGVQAFPTTWFLDGKGRKVFEKVGWSEKLFEEFGWRIEAIRGAAPVR